MNRIKIGLPMVLNAIIFLTLSAQLVLAQGIEVPEREELSLIHI